MTAWTHSTIDLNRVFFKLTPEAIQESKIMMEKISDQFPVDQFRVDLSLIPHLVTEINTISKEVDHGQKVAILDGHGDFSPLETEKIHWIISQILGETIVQNEEGRHLIHIYDRDPKKRIKDGARYHQTHESGAIHTDNVNIPENYQYLLVGCAMPAMIGGENIIVSGLSVYNYLQKNAPLELKILMSDFIFEYRGISRELYHAPIITFSENQEPLFRHLRTYMESAHSRADCPLTDDQIRAIDALDATLSMSEFQLIYRLKSGQILIANDSQVLHDRRTFVDHADSITLDELKKSTKENDHSPLKRTLLRTWVRKI